MIEPNAIDYLNETLKNLNKIPSTAMWLTLNQLIELKRYLINKECLINGVYIIKHKNILYTISFERDLAFIETPSTGFIYQVFKKKDIFLNN